jgi:hypothetical protein
LSYAGHSVTTSVIITGESRCTIDKNCSIDGRHTRTIGTSVLPPAGFAGSAAHMADTLDRLQTGCAVVIVRERQTHKTHLSTSTGCRAGD